MTSTFEELAAMVSPAGEAGEEWLPPERELAVKLRVSRPVLREALKRLESQGLVEIRHGVGVKVVDRLHRPVGMSLALRIPDLARRLKHLMEARLVIEPEVAARAASRRRRKHIQALKRAQEQLAAATSAEEAVQHDLQFHRLLAAASGNQVLMLMLDAMSDLGTDSRRITISRYGIPRAHRQHAAILAAIEAGDPEAAREMMRRHVRAASRDLRTQLA